MGPKGPIRETTPKGKGGRPAGPDSAHQGASRTKGGRAGMGLVPYRLATKCGSPPPPIYMGAPSPFEGILFPPNSLALPHVWVRKIGSAYGVRVSPPYTHRRVIGASVELFIFRCCRWAGAGGSSIHRMCVKLRRHRPPVVLVAGTTTGP